MSQIKHDASGFLIGELIESSKAMLASQQSSASVWRGIRADVSAIARAMGVASRASSAQQRSPRTVAEPVGRSATASAGAKSYGTRVSAIAPAARGADGRFVASGRQASKAAQNSASPDQGITGALPAMRRPAVALAVVAAPDAARDGRGRYAAGKELPDGGRSVGNVISDKLGAVADAVKGFSQNAENVDPAITAMGEIKSVLEPFGRGAFALFGRGEKQQKERWYSRFLKALTVKKDEPRPASGGDSGSSTWLGLDFPLKLIAGIGTALVAALGVIGAAGLGVYIGTKIYEWLDKSGIATKVFDAFDSVGKWFKDKVDGVKSDYQKGRDSAGTGPRAELLGMDGRNTNDPRRLDRQPLAPPTSLPEAVGRVIGNFKRGGDYMAGEGKITPNDKKVDARWAGGARADLTNASVAAGVDPGLVAQIGRFESGFSSTASPTRRDGSKISSAHGYGQFIDGTWTDMVNRHGAKYGVEGAGNLTKEQAGALRNDPKLQASMLAEFTKENVAKGRANGGKDDAANVYAYHNLGDGDAKRVLSAVKASPEMSVRDALIGGRDIGEKERARIENVISGNKSLYGNGNIPASEAYSRMGQKMRDGDAYAADARMLASSGGAAKQAGVAQSPGAVSVASLPAVMPANIPSSIPQKIAASPEVVVPPAAAPEKERPIIVSSSSPVGQNVGDRTIAHTASGGIGATGRW